MKETPTIVIDARWITPTPSGIGVYTRELIRRLPAAEPDWKWHLLFKDDKVRKDVIADCGFENNPKVTAELLPYGIFSPKGQLLLPAKLRKIGCDLFHSTNFMIPYLAFGSPMSIFSNNGPKDKNCGVCVTNIHDVIPLILKEYAPRSKTSRMLWLYKACIRNAVRFSKATITGSESARKDLCNSLNLSIDQREKVKTIYDGVSERFTEKESESAPSDTKVVLYVGRLDPYKNVPELVDAFAQVFHKSDKKLHLLIVGPYDARYPEARQHAYNRGISENVTFLHDASDNELLDAYKTATVLVNPSLYEGFGLPMLEAMKCGTPVICADGGSQREISGGAAEVVPPSDGPALVAALEKVLSSKETRDAMTQKGLKRAAEFTWDRTVRQTLEVYRSALGMEAKE